MYCISELNSDICINKFMVMAKIENEAAYKAALERIEELLPLVDDATPLTDINLIELDLLAGLVVDYEDEYYPIKPRTES